MRGAAKEKSPPHAALQLAINGELAPDWVCSFSLSRVVFISLSVFSLFSGSGLPSASPNQKPVRG